MPKCCGWCPDWVDLPAMLLASLIDSNYLQVSHSLVRNNKRMQLWVIEPLRADELSAKCNCDIRNEYHEFK